MIEISNSLLEAMCKQMPQMSQMPLSEVWRCVQFTDRVACLIAEEPEFRTKEPIYDAIKNAFNRIILEGIQAIKREEFERYQEFARVCKQRGLSHS